MPKVLKFAAAALLLVVVAGAAFYGWASVASAGVLDQSFAVHEADFPIPFPLDVAEIEEAGLSPEEADALAMERAVERGAHLLESRYGCGDCHGANFGGGVMVDAFPIGTLLGPNITTGEGSRTATYGPADWDRIVRHGVLPDGRPAIMPSIDFRSMSDQELSDIVAYIQAQPPIDAEIQAPTLGPLGRVLVATGQIPLSADALASVPSHMALPPLAEVTLDFGEHLAAPCAGCHGPALSGGVIPGGDPSWVPAANLTPHEGGLAEWSFADFDGAMRTGVRPDGTPLRLPMTLAIPLTQNLTDVEMEALWMYLTSLDAVPTGER